MTKTKYPIFKGLHRGEKGFTLIELLIVVAILGIIAAVVIPNVGGFLKTGRLAAANTEVGTVKTALGAYNAENDGEWPANSNNLTAYLDRPTKTVYTIDAANGKITGVHGTPDTLVDNTAYPGLDFVLAEQQWKITP